MPRERRPTATSRRAKATTRKPPKRALAPGDMAECMTDVAAGAPEGSAQSGIAQRDDRVEELVTAAAELSGVVSTLEARLNRLAEAVADAREQVASRLPERPSVPSSPSDDRGALTPFVQAESVQPVAPDESPVASAGPSVQPTPATPRRRWRWSWLGIEVEIEWDGDSPSG